MSAKIFADRALVKSDRLVIGRRRAAGFALVGNVVPIGVAVASDWSSLRLVFLLGALGGCLVPVLVTLPVRFTVIRRVAAPSGLICVTLLQAYSGGISSGYVVLLMMPMIWYGLQASDREIMAMIVVLTGCAFAPMLVIGAPAYPVHWGNAALVLMIGSTVAWSLRSAVREVITLTGRLREEAVIDPLTGLLNRRGWQRTAPAILQRARRNEEPVSVVAVDLDAFKTHNDTHGHDEGDRLLCEVADHIKAGLRADDVAARMGGDEFLLLLANTDSDAALDAVSRLQSLSSAGTFSAGIAQFDLREGLDDLLRRADLALYAAKAAGGNRCEVALLCFEADSVSLPRLASESATESSPSRV
jgi:diguanylate cyclase (GGDEF)-like protein